MDLKEIREILETTFGDDQIELQAEGNKLVLSVVSEKFEGLSRVKRQQLVYSLLNDRISSGEIHAVTMTTLTLRERAGSDQTK
ncbi:MAG: BolA/IbaG family iron-sulfur metabolism protein [Gammaproteobacteria bacterium]|nr:BolA/IbaG family iron-sulfur metabolism protein [Gammaproteobacteria bacterium]